MKILFSFPGHFDDTPAPFLLQSAGMLCEGLMLVDTVNKGQEPEQSMNSPALPERKQMIKCFFFHQIDYVWFRLSGCSKQNIKKAFMEKALISIVFYQMAMKNTIFVIISHGLLTPTVDDIIEI